MGATLQDRQTGPITPADLAVAGDARYQQLNAPDPGILWGYIMSTVGASATITVGVGAAVDSTNVIRMRNTSNISKTTSPWAAGNNAGGLDTSTIAVNTWYHWFAIYNPTTLTTDVVFSATTTPGNGPSVMPAGFTLFRRIGSAKTNASSQWTKFVQFGDQFIWDNAPQDINTSGFAATYTNVTLPNVPPNIVTDAILAAGAALTGSDCRASIIPVDSASTTPGTNSWNFGFIGPTGNQEYTQLVVRVGTTQQVRLACQTTASSIFVGIIGWYDTRGRFQ